jgi:hypothetical protein
MMAQEASLRVYGVPGTPRVHVRQG